MKLWTAADELFARIPEDNVKITDERRIFPDQRRRGTILRESAPWMLFIYNKMSFV